MKNDSQYSDQTFGLQIKESLALVDSSYTVIVVFVIYVKYCKRDNSIPSQFMLDYCHWIVHVCDVVSGFIMVFNDERVIYECTESGLIRMCSM